MKKVWMKHWLVLGALAVCTAPCMVACDDDDETEVIKEVVKEVNVSIPGMDISKFTIGANGGQSVVGIAPSDSWKMVSKTDWLKITPAEGSVAVTEVTLEAEANTGFESRPATVEVTVGDTTMTKTVIQEGIARYITIYGDTIFFDRETMEARISPITANVAIEVVTEKLPSWVESAELTQHPAGYYEALIVAKSGDIDDTERMGEIVFKDKASDFEVAFPVVSVAMALDGKYSNDWKKIETFSGAREFTVTVYRESSMEEDTLLIYEKSDGAFTYTKPMAMVNGKVEQTVKVSRVTSGVNAAVLASVYKLEVIDYQDDWGAPERRFWAFIIAKSEAEDFNPNRPAGGNEYPTDFNFKQKNMAPFFTNITCDRSEYSFKVGEPTEVRVTVNSSLITALDIRAIYSPYFYSEDPLASYSEEFPIDVEYIRMEGTEDGFITYVYKITANQVSDMTKGNLVLCMLAKDAATGKYVMDGSMILHPSTSSGEDILMQVTY